MMRSERTKIILFLFLCVFLLQGCLVNKEEAEKEILSYDSSFQKEIQRRNGLQEELNSARDSYSQEVDSIEEQKRALKEKKDQLKREFDTSVDEIKRQIEPARRDLQHDLAKLERDHKIRKSELKEIRKDIEEIDALIDKKEKLILTQEEIRTWNDRRSALVEKQALLNAEAGKLAEEIRITKLKIKVLVLK